MAEFQPIGGKAAWTAADVPTKDAFAFDLRPRHVAALEAAARGPVSEHRVSERQALAPEDFDLGPIAADVATIGAEVLHGRGMVLVRGFPIAGLGIDDIALMYRGLGAHLGRAVSQSLMGDRLGHVLDAARADQHARGYRSARELDPHTDSDDIVGLLCLRPGRSGGETLLSSAHAVHDALLAESPRHLPLLYRGFHYHWIGEEPPGEPPVTSYRIPVFAARDGLWSTVYLRHFIDMAFAAAGGAPDEDKAALDAMDRVATRADVQLRFRLEPGELILFNNYTCLHGRSAFVDDEAPGRHRHLLRLWLKARPPRPVHDAIRRYYGEDGMPEQERGRGRYAGDTMGASPGGANPGEASPGGAVPGGAIPGAAA
ncbi:MAG: TauD/TfdA family dioxygenase [Alphaproteobacteria bacterium]